MTDVQIWTFCDRCGGTGEVSILITSWECGKCGGDGRLLETKQVDHGDLNAWERSFE